MRAFIRSIDISFILVFFSAGNPNYRLYYQMFLKNLKKLTIHTYLLTCNPFWSSCYSCHAYRVYFRGTKYFYHFQNWIGKYLTSHDKSTYLYNIHLPNLTPVVLCLFDICWDFQNRVHFEWIRHKLLAAFKLRVNWTVFIYLLQGWAD